MEIRKNKPEVTTDQIQVRAYEIYLERERGGCDGNDLDDWLAAERELLGAQRGSDREEEQPISQPTLRTSFEDASATSSREIPRPGLSRGVGRS